MATQVHTQVVFDTIAGTMSHQRIKLYQGSVSDCSYLEDRETVNIYADPHHPEPRSVYNQLIQRGFRRSGEFVYRPGCPQCDACVPVRVVCDEFRPRRTDKRNLKLNADLEINLSPAEFTEEYFDLYNRYLVDRHAGGGMDNPSPADFERFLLNPWSETLFLDVRLDGKLVASAVTDSTTDGLSAVYTFFDPTLPKRALGRYCILQQIEFCKMMNLPYLYMGYWVNDCRKMAYKTDFLPQEHFGGHNWDRIDSKKDIVKRSCRG